MKNAAAVVVTYNRLNLLKESLSALLNQSVPCDILVIDNASTDGTGDYIHSIADNRIIYRNTGKNLGGAGGFSFGMNLVENLGYQYAWIMDDDSVPQPNALESLFQKAECVNNTFSFLASLVYWTDGTVFEMNFPLYKRKDRMDICPDCISKYKMMPIENASFVGCFVNLSVSRKVGLPISEFFIYGDDKEYTGRLRKELPAFLDFDSIIVHKAPSNKGADIATAEENRISRFYHQARNGMYMARKQGFAAVIKRFKIVFIRTGKILIRSKNKKCLRLWMLYKGTIAGFFFNPTIRYSSESKDLL